MNLPAFWTLARFDKPTGLFLLIFPVWWSVLAASNGAPDFKTLTLLTLGAVLLRPAGCILNDLIDRNLDKKVARTKNRPLASGAISPFQAIIFMGLLLAGGLWILLQLNDLTIKLGLIAVGLIALYPFMKNITWWPQAFLGITFNWGALMGWAAVTGSLDIPAFVIYAACVFWTIGYDTIYAYQDVKDDKKQGVKSTALKFGLRYPAALTGFYGETTLLLIVVGIWMGLGLIYWAALVATIYHFHHQIKYLNVNSPQDCQNHFVSNIWPGMWMTLGFLLG